MEVAKATLRTPQAGQVLRASSRAGSQSLASAFLWPESPRRCPKKELLPSTKLPDRLLAGHQFNKWDLFLI